MSKKARAESKRKTKLNLKKAKRARVSCFECLLVSSFSTSGGSDVSPLGPWLLEFTKRDYVLQVNVHRHSS